MSGAPSRAPANESWWQRAGLERVDGELRMAGYPLRDLAVAADVPLYCYDADRVRAKLQMLHDALATTGLPHRVFYAMKANRFVPLLGHIRATGLAGIDACSPREAQLALACGFDEADVSYTANSVSEADLDWIARHPRMLVNCDALSTIRRLGERGRGREIGLRINPAMGFGYADNEKLTYAGAKTTKFGIYREHLEEALTLAARYEMRVGAVHFHVGIGYLTPQLERFDEILGVCAEFIERIGSVRCINVGGGLGLPHVATDAPLDLSRWASILAARLGRFGAELRVEPGDFLVKDAGALVLRVNTVERKRDVTFVGLDGGFNLAMEPVFYGLPCEPVACRIEDPAAPWSKVTLVGNINEALDVWASDVLMPPLREGDHVALLNAGGYASAMGSEHCLRGVFQERLLLAGGGAAGRGA